MRSSSRRRSRSTNLPGSTSLASKVLALLGAFDAEHREKYAPRGDLPVGEQADEYADVDVPKQDLRAIRRAILDLDTFYSDTTL